MIQRILKALTAVIKKPEKPAPENNDFDLTEPGTDRMILNEQQLKVHELLEGLSLQKDQFGHWYLAALESLRERSRDYLSQAAHSIREITDKLPTRAGVPMFRTPVPKTREVLTKLLKIKSDSYGEGWEGAPITKKLAVTLSGFEELQSILDETPRTLRMRSALELRDPYSHGISPVHRRERDKEFRNLGDFFQNVAHHNSTPTHETFLENLESFENLLISYLSPVTGAQQKEILEVIESPPNHEKEARLNALLLHNGANLLFMLERLKEPLWIPFLERLELFKHPRSGEPTEEGGMIYRSDPALSCLARLAPLAPDQVLTTLEKLPKTDNPQIPDQVMRCIIGIEDTALIPRCLNILKSILDESQGGHWIWLEEILGSWWRLNAHDEMVELLRAYLGGLIKASGAQRKHHDWEFQEIDRNAIPALSTVKPLAVAKVVFKALCFWASIEIRKRAGEPPLFGIPDEDFNDPDCDNPPTYWLEDFSSHSIGSHDLEGTLARRLFQIGSSIFERGDPNEISEFDHLLRSNPWHLFTRLRWQLYANHPKHSVEHASKDVLARILRLSRSDATHGYELAQMLEAHCLAHGDTFLPPKEVESFCDTVRSGPIDSDGIPISEDSYPKRFHRKQLHPIRHLLQGDNLNFYNKLSEDLPELRLTSFKPFSSGGARMIENVPPKKASEMPAMSDAELWDFLNNWVPNPKRPDPEKWWVEEDVGVLGVMFAELLESTPGRFPASTEWWKNLTRVNVLFKPLERASARITEEAKNDSATTSNPSKDEWRNWFGLASWIAQQRVEAVIEDPSETKDQDGFEAESRDWDWPCIVVVKFLTTTLCSKFHLPPDLHGEVGRLLRKLIEDPDLRLADKDKPWMDDWLTTAINSVRGTAVDGLLELALFNKKNGGDPDPDGWIYDLIVDRLKMLDESPAVFAIFGSRLRLLLYLFHEQLKTSPDLLLPPDLKDRSTLILSHFRYDNPMPLIIETLPALPDAAIDCLAEMNSQEQDDQEARGDYGGQLGIHFGFYYWNESFPDQTTADAILDRYFATAKPSHRGNFIRHIARVFAKSPDTDDFRPLHKMVCRLWDRRFTHIEQDLAAKRIEPADVHSELSAFIDWLGCEGLPFEWRHAKVLSAINLLEKAPGAGFTIETLERISAKPERLCASLEILIALMSKDSQELRWTYQTKYLKPIMLRGISSENLETKKLAEAAQELLLRQGQFEYLDLTPEPNALK